MQIKNLIKNPDFNYVAANLVHAMVATRLVFFRCKPGMATIKLQELQCPEYFNLRFCNNMVGFLKTSHIYNVITSKICYKNQLSSQPSQQYIHAHIIIRSTVQI